jgi:threonine synthase
MKYISTRGQVEPVDFQQAVMMGLADDGGLLVPESIPDVADRLARWRGLSYADLAFEVLSLFADDIPAADLRELVARTYSARVFEPAVAPVVRVGPVWILELWHGPTLAFKDVALQLLGNLFEYILARRGGRLNIVGATSGDTGSAAIYGVRGRRGIDIFIMHPRGRTSPIQERQMTSVLDPNVHNIAIEGSFDDCQRIMKELACDLEFKRAYNIGAVNSVNWARVLAQIVYYFSAAFEVQKRVAADMPAPAAAGEGMAPGRVRFAVPTGNFGDVLAGWYAMQMGAPISQLVLATNENDILSRFFKSGVYSVGEVVQTWSPSMDIQVASNFERYLYHKVGQDGGRLRQMMAEFGRTGSLSLPAAKGQGVDPALVAGSATKQQTLDTIRQYYEQYQYVLDPHTAVGVSVAQQLGEDTPSQTARRCGVGEPLICLATAHPAKFPDAIVQATGKDVACHAKIDALANLPTRCQTLPNDKDAVREFIIGKLGV